MKPGEIPTSFKVCPEPKEREQIEKYFHENPEIKRGKKILKWILEGIKREEGKAS